LSDTGQELALAAGRCSYSIAGHAPGGILQIVPLSGREAKNVIPFSPRVPRKAEAHAGSTDGAA
jgi:hypothetical protein